MEKKPVAQAVRRTLLKNRVLWLYGTAALTSFAVFWVFWCSNIYHNAIISGLALRNGTESFMLWQRPPVRLIYKAYIFNYTNVEEFERGEASKLRVQEVGPYIYRETLNRINVDLNKNDTVTYQEKRSFQWEGGRSDDESVMVPNIPLITAVSYSRGMSFVAKVGLTALLATLRAKPFVEVPAGGFLWGYEDRIYQMARPFLSFQENASRDKFGVLAFKNGVNDDRITMHTGTDDLDRLGLIERINGMQYRHVWDGDSCDRVLGTDGSMFPPHMIRDKNTTLYVYAKDICRKMPFRYESRAYSHGMPTARYYVPKDTFTSTSAKDACFCAKDSDGSRRCPPAGIYNISHCNGDSPLLASFPHFYCGDESLFEYIDGLDPRDELHRTYMDLHPRLGLPISGSSKFQLNLEVRRTAAIPLSGNLHDGLILPLIWVEAAVDRIPKPILNRLHGTHYTINAIEAGIQWCSLIAVILSCGAFLVSLQRLQRSRRVAPVEISRECVVELVKSPAAGTGARENPQISRHCP